MNSPPILEPIFSGDWDVHWGYDLDFDPWPCLFILKSTTNIFLWCILPRDVRTLTLWQLMGVPKLLAGDQKATEICQSPRHRPPDCH